VTDTTSVSGGIFNPGVALAIVDAFPKFKQRGSTPKRSLDPDHAPFEGNFFFTPGVGLAIVDPLAKFKERSVIHVRNIKGV